MAAKTKTKATTKRKPANEDWCVAEVWKKRNGRWSMHVSWDGTHVRSQHGTRIEAAREASMTLRQFAGIGDADS